MSSSIDPIIGMLKASNAVWAERVSQDKPNFFHETTKGQTPKILWIGCADSRVPESVILGAAPGDIFVHRNIANQVRLDDASALSVLQYGVENVGVEHVIISGHTHCGGALACVQGVRGRLPVDPKSTLAGFLSPIVELADGLGLSDENIPTDKALMSLVEENVRVQVKNVITTETMQNIWKMGKNVVVHGWVYHLGSGRVVDLGVSYGLNEYKQSAPQKE
ncbi:carbonic anhydrase [Clavulina sp. PMI_390]|nr:carbonic anhydrase [Clavulina sp. PMI_390]